MDVKDLFTTLNCRKQNRKNIVNILILLYFSKVRCIFEIFFK
jgi:hypothetical protein